MRQQLKPYYSHLGRPSVDPELIVRMLVIGYVLGIRSERRLCDEVHLNLAYRWFCRLGIDGKVPDHSTFSKYRHGKFCDSDLLCSVFEGTVARCISEGLVGGHGFAVDASLIEADVDRMNSSAQADWDVSAAAGVRDDYDALTLRGLARKSEDLRQVRRLLSLACVYDGMSRADAAKGGEVARQSLRDRGHRFNEAGPEGLFDRRVPRPQMRMRPRWLNLLRSSNPAPALSMTLETDGGSAGDDLTFNGGAKTGSVLSLTRGPSPGCLQRPADQRYKPAAVCADRETGAALMVPCCHGRTPKQGTCLSRRSAGPLQKALRPPS